MHAYMQVVVLPRATARPRAWQSSHPILLLDLRTVVDITSTIYLSMYDALRCFMHLFKGGLH